MSIFFMNEKMNNLFSAFSLTSNMTSSTELCYSLFCLSNFLERDNMKSRAISIRKIST